MRIALFIPCFVDTLFPETGIAATRLLERLGYEVVFEPEQTCCGQMHFNSGYTRDALPLARRFVELFSRADAVVAPSASCVAMVREGYRQLGETEGANELVEFTRTASDRIHELSEFLVHRVGVTDLGAYYPHRVTYHPTCHALRSLRLDDAPLELLRGVRGLELIELASRDECCGFGGTFAVKNADVSAAMLADKVSAILATEAEVCCAVDHSCLMHIGGALTRQRTGVKTAHLAEILVQTGERP